MGSFVVFSMFFFIDTATTEIYTLSLHDALPISSGHGEVGPRAGYVREPRRPLAGPGRRVHTGDVQDGGHPAPHVRSEEHTSELQSHSDLVCRLLLEKKKTKSYASSFCNGVEYAA